jgi:hypothetical protein
MKFKIANKINDFKHVSYGMAVKKNLFADWRIVVLFAVALLNFNFRASAALATVWHIPDNITDLGFNMRNPEFAIGTNTTVTFYTAFGNGTTVCKSPTRPAVRCFTKLPRRSVGAMSD